MRGLGARRDDAKRRVLEPLRLRASAGHAGDVLRTQGGLRQVHDTRREAHKSTCAVLLPHCPRRFALRCVFDAHHSALSSAFYLVHCRQQASIPASQRPAHPSKEPEMELLIGFVTTLCISLLIFRT
jgi:hypothetical protein